MSSRGNQGAGNYPNLSDHLNSVRNSTKPVQFGVSNIASPTSAGGAQGALNSTRVPKNNNKLIDSKLSSLRNEQDSTAASNINQRFPMTPDEAFKTVSHLMWEVEKREIFEYKTIYFFPIEERKKQKNCGMHANSHGAQSEMGIFNEATNNGFDNDQNEYIIRMNEHLGFRYEVVKKCGKGSFGVVLKCYDHK